MKILVTGAQGRLGSRLIETLQHETYGVDIDTLDITDAERVFEEITKAAPDWVIHCAAMTAVDECARQPDLALRINGLGTKNIALACQALDAAMVYISTNEVFDGQNTGTILEYDTPNPINAYGYSKWVGEQIVMQHLQKFMIVRTSWLFAHGGRNFIQAILARAQAGDPLRVVVNEVAVPTYNDDVAAAIIQLVAAGQYGIYHVVNEGRASRWAFAREILDQMGYTDTSIEKIAAIEYDRPSTPPEYSVLRNMIAAEMGIALRPWQDAVAAYLQREGLRA